MAVSILIIDDVQSNRDYLKSLLGKHFSLLEASGGKEGLALCLEHKPDLIICDILMPEMDGYKLVSEIRRIPDICDTRVIFLTAYFNDAEAYQLASQAGVFNVIAKPCDPQELLGKVKKALADITRTATDTQRDEYRLSHERLLTNKLVEQCKELFDSRERVANLIELNLNLASQNDVSELLAIVCHGAKDLVEADAAVLIVREKTNGQVAQCSTSGIDADSDKVRIDSGIFSPVFRKRETKTISLGELHQPGEVGLPEDFPAFRSLLAVPVVSLTQSYGWLCLMHLQENDFSSEDELIVSILAAQTGRIYENGSLYMKIRQHAQKLEQEIRFRSRIQLHLTVQYESERLLSHATDIDEVVPRVLKLVGDSLGFSAARIWEYDKEADRFLCIHDWICDTSQLAEYHENSRLLESHGVRGLLDTVVAEKKEIWIEDVTETENYKMLDEESRRLLSMFKMKGMAAMPVLIDDQVWGVLMFRSRERLEESDETLNVLNTISRQIGFYSERLQQKESIESLNRLYSVLSSFNNAIVLTNERQQLMQLACDIVVKVGDFQSVWVGCFDESLNDPRVFALQSSQKVSVKANEVLSLLSSLDITADKVFSGPPFPVVRNRLRNTDINDKSYPLDILAVKQNSKSYAALLLDFPDYRNCILVLSSDEADIFDEREMILLNELAADLSYAVRNIENERKLDYLAYHDPVTHLINRNSFVTSIENEILQQLTARSFFGVAVLHINHFRKINDSLGYRIGDELLHKVGERMLKVVGQDKAVASLGGKEFALLLDNVKSTREANEKILGILQSLHMTYQLADIPVNVEMCGGLAFYPEHGDSAELLIQNADIALRQAREQNRKYLVYSPEFDTMNSQQLALIGELRGAIERDEFFLVYQPIINLNTMKVNGVEALIRWEHPEIGTIFPDMFIPQVEQTDLINDLTLWVIRTALRDNRAWQAKGVQLDLSVNLSVRSLLANEFAKSILELVQDARFDLNTLILEITESAVMTDPVGSKQVLMNMHEAGIRFSLDDFGTGQSSLSYLKNLPVDKLKIDKTFVFDIYDSQNSAIVRTAIELGHNLGLSVVAEGIENQESLSLLREFNCDQGQGYFFSKGMRSEDLMHWFAETESEGNWKSC